MYKQHDEAEMRRERLKRAFYAPPARRKTSAEIISEARAAIYGDSSSSSSSASIRGGTKPLKPLLTRRPFTPSENQRILFAERAAKRHARPPSVFTLKPPPPESNEFPETVEVSTGHEAFELNAQPSMPDFEQEQIRTKKQRSRSKRQNDFPSLPKQKLPNFLSQSKVAQQKRISEKQGKSNDSKNDKNLECAISISQPLRFASFDSTNTITKNVSQSDLRSSQELCKSKSFVDTPLVQRRKTQSVLRTRLDDVCDSKKKAELTPGIVPLFNNSINTIGTDIGAIAVHKLEAQTAPTVSTDILDPKSEFVSQYQSILEVADQLLKRKVPNMKVVSQLSALEQILFQPTNKALLLGNISPGGLSGNKSALMTKARTQVLKALLSHVDSEDEILLLQVARLLLAMRVTGIHLSVACKLTFKVARNDKNDRLFKNSDILELLIEGAGRACPLTEGECCVYAAGALRFLVLEPSLRLEAVNAGALHLASVHLKILNTAKCESPREVSEQSSHALYQLTGAVRNMATDHIICEQFLNANLLQELCLTLKYFITDIDVVTNVVRTLSVLSAEDACCEWMCTSDETARALLRALCAVASRAPLAVRLTYALGNMAAASRKVRDNIYYEPGAIDCLLSILETYITMRDHNSSGVERKRLEDDPEFYLIGSDEEGSNVSYEDVLVKTVRVLANLCLEEKAGRGLADIHASRLIRSLLSCCNLETQNISGKGDGCPNEELLCASLATLNNLTYYHEPNAQGSEGREAFAGYMMDMCNVCNRCLDLGGQTANEAIRVLGNLTRSPQACQLLANADTLRSLGPYLIEDESDICCAAAGVLVNTCAWSGNTDCGALATSALRAAVAARDICTASLLVRALWNVVTGATVLTLPADAIRPTASALNAVIGDDSIFSPCEQQPSESDSNSDPISVSSNASAYNFRGHDQPYIIRNVVENGEDVDDSGLEDLDYGFEDSTSYCGGQCVACVKLAAWEELVKVAVPLLDRLKPLKTDASVGTEESSDS